MRTERRGRQNLDRAHSSLAGRGSGKQESVYEPIFIRNSFGFRPRRGTDDAIKANYNILKDDKRSFVVEIDLTQFFNTVPHRTLLKQLRKKIQAPRRLGLIARLFKWLNRRSQRKSFSYAKFKRMLKRDQLPLPPEPTKLKQHGWSPYAK